MLLVTNCLQFEYTLRNITLLFYSGEKITVVEEGAQPLEEPYLALTAHRGEGGLYQLHGRSQEKGNAITLQKNHVEEEKLKTSLASLCFSLLRQRTGLTPPWGTLTGVRPVKLYRNLVQKLGAQQADTYFGQTLCVSPKKHQLVQSIAHIQNQVLCKTGEEDYSLYISIPFCPTRCSYCSFVSSSIHTTAPLVVPHLHCLFQELSLVHEKMCKLGKTLKSIYIGGGTPTILSANQLDKLFAHISATFDTKDVIEYTLEAGRPDTIDKAKLQVAKDHGITRLNINPQTMEDHVLAGIGRRHNSQQILDCFHMARAMGFQNINMDLIAGLAGDTLAGFQRTVEKVLALSPENITVHTLYMKRTSQEVMAQKAKFRSADMEVGQMVDFAKDAFTKAGYSPFYMYRQRNTVANLENTGYTKAGYASPYNVWSMDESHTIIGCGAGAVSKLVQNKGERIQRIFNYKLPEDYVKEFGKELEKKSMIDAFFCGEKE